ncbi:unnamed protein product [Prorocentrum cordatum]|uniref:Uncharacterized protein n=1 Tax=Prorocentrum cordatum TaxID=2364126 RepID=A0ABN9QS53_9DINO|nr:unnamed protein product [Polarella glacialis]
MLTPSQRAEIERAIAVLEGDTPYRFRVLAPPPGLGPENKREWSSVVKSVKAYWAEDPKWDNENTVVTPHHYPPEKSEASRRESQQGRCCSPVTPLDRRGPGDEEERRRAASRARRRRLVPPRNPRGGPPRTASDTFTKIGNKFGTAGYVNAEGEGGAVVASSLNAIACLRRGVCMQPLGEEEVASLVAGGAPVLDEKEAKVLATSNARWSSRK